MNSRFLVCIMLLASLWACEKNESTLPTKTTEANYFPLTTGSYWVYNTYVIDSLKNEKLVSENDTVEIIGDSLLNGKSYAVFYGKPYGFSNGDKVEKYYLDSSGYIVQLNGNIIFSQTNFNDTLYTEKLPNTDSAAFYYSCIMQKYEQDLDLLCGVFDSVLNYQFKVKYLQASPQLVVDIENLYAPNVGRLLRQNFYASVYEAKQEYYEERLVDYHIEP